MSSHAPHITLDHGSGGLASHMLLRDLLLPRLDNPFLRRLDDSATVPIGPGRLAFTTDSYVVDPIFFPGGDIGSLAVHGTVNDLAMQGATPLFLTLGLILEEGLPLSSLATILDSIAEASSKAQVHIVAGDTKVVPRGHADKIFISTSGIGNIPEGIDTSSINATPGDQVLINGPIADHGLAILGVREGLHFRSQIQSDTAPLNHLVSAILHVCPTLHVLRDPTRGGLATALCEIAAASGVGITLFEEALPIRPPVAAAAELLGIDPLYVANEGKAIVIASPQDAPSVLSTMHAHPHGKDSVAIGHVHADRPGHVFLKTRVGGTRILSMLTGEQLPRIC